MNSNYRSAWLIPICLLSGYGCSTNPPQNTVETIQASEQATPAITHQSKVAPHPIEPAKLMQSQIETDLEPNRLQISTEPAETEQTTMPSANLPAAAGTVKKRFAVTDPKTIPAPDRLQPRESVDTNAVALPATQEIPKGRRNNPAKAKITSSIQTGQLQNPSLTEVSGLAASRINPEVLFAINDSGNSATLYALSDSGMHLAQWPVQARNRDWEDLATLRRNDVDYLVIGDTGDNLQLRTKSTLYLIPEPSVNTVSGDTLKPAFTLNFTYEDGPRNVEAFASYQQSIYLMSKEPVSSDGPSNSHVYELKVPDSIGDDVLVARRVADLPLGRMSLEGQLAASLAGVDLNQPTALDIDANGTTAYILTYRHVLRVDRKPGQSWPDAFAESSSRIHAHNLGQAEALAVAPERAIFLTSENRSAPIWALPLSPLL